MDELGGGFKVIFQDFVDYFFFYFVYGQIFIEDVECILFEFDFNFVSGLRYSKLFLVVEKVYVVKDEVLVGECILVI